MDHKQDILRILREDARLSNEEIAQRLGLAEKTVASTIKKLEKDGVIVGFRALFDDSLLPENAVKAIIEVKIKPERNGGFDRIAKRISKFSESGHKILRARYFSVKHICKRCRAEQQQAYYFSPESVYHHKSHKYRHKNYSEHCEFVW